eukprot:TRINITY_DN8745_c0_g1_i6.p2 TRINITY_DN8745_c0_g1~~TRINITY_DN8745_c0_g1_i6.p2  ORF type:complete len:151 (+),score=33.16 TRINITY_DN8745_c0_g1_i6:2-454(+)
MGVKSKSKKTKKGGEEQQDQEARKHQTYMYQEENSSLLDNVARQVWRLLRNKLDRYIIYPKTRWTITTTLYILYAMRIVDVGGFYVISYILGLYILHLIVQFLTPIGLPDIDEDDDEKMVGAELPSTTRDADNDDYRPMIRSVGEFHLWQ